MQLVDSHCHLQFKGLKDRLGEVITDVKIAHVSKIICVGTSLNDSQQTIDLVQKYDNVWATVGAHPHDGADYLKDARAEEKLKQMLGRPKVVAIGEIGLDYYHAILPKKDQQKVLRSQIEMGLEASLPFIFHVRDSWSDFWRIYDSYSAKHGVVHSFSASADHLEEILSRGLYVSLNGIMTFTKDGSQLEAAKKIPAKRLLLESDAPFLAPKPFRGQTNEPKYIRNIAEFLAGLQGEKLEDLAQATTQNARELFGI